jgi:MoaA/NifB/PqqE/SkfB family radical SAM enzyme
MLNLGKFILKRFLLDTEKLKFALPRMFPPSDPKLTTLRIKNFISTYLAWKFGLKLNTKPVILQIEPVRGCNLNCIMCGAGQLKLQKLSFDDFKKIIDYFPEAIAINMNFWGEPFLSKDTLKMINYAQKKFIITIFSNFTILPPAEDIINSGLSEIHASIDSFNKEKYNFIRRAVINPFSLVARKISEDLKKLYPEGMESQIFKYENAIYINENQDTFDKVIKNLKNLIYTRNKLKKKLPIISISSAFAKETKEDAEDIIKNAIDLGVDRVKFIRLTLEVPGMLHSPDHNDYLYLLELKKKYKGQIEIIPVNFNLDPELKGYCSYAYFMTLVDIFGNIFPCCLPYPMLPIFENTEPSKFGNAGDGIKKAIEKRQHFIKNFRDNPPEFCKKCPLYLREK